MDQLKRILNNIFDLSKPFPFILTLGFLFFINFSIFACYLLFSLLTIILIVHVISKKKIPAVPDFFKYFIPFIFLTLVSTIFSIDRWTSLKDNRDLLILLLFPIFIATIISGKRLIISLTVVGISTIFSAIFGIFNVLQEGISLDHRLKGFTSHWMTYAGLLMLVFVFGFIHLFQLKRKTVRTILLVSLIIILAAILFSQTRQVWVGIAVALGLFIIFFRPKVFFFALPAILILTIVLPDTVKHRIVSIFDLKNETNKDRIYMVHTGFRIFKDYPLTGVGANNVGKVYDKYRHPQASLHNTHLHNNFLHILAERGILTLVAMLVAFIFILITLIKRMARSSGQAKIFAQAVLFVFVAFLTAGLFEYNFGDSEVKFMLFFFLSIPFLQITDTEYDLIEKI